MANMLAGAEPPFAAAAETTAAEVRSSKVVASDETSARVEGKNWWQWVLLSSTAVHHLIADSRGAAVLTDFLGESKPDVWVADRYAASSRAWKRAPAMPRPPAPRRPIRPRLFPRQPRHRRHPLPSGPL